MILVLKVKLLFGAYAKSEWEGVIEIHSSSTLEDLHLAILDALGFDNDHLYEFFIARTERSRERVRFNDESGELYSTTVESLYLRRIIDTLEQFPAQLVEEQIQELSADPQVGTRFRQRLRSLALRYIDE